MPLTFVGNASGLAGNPLHVTVYDGAENLIPNEDVVWTRADGAPLPATLTVTPDPAGPGFNFISTAVAAVNVKATVGVASATILLNFLGLKFTSP